MPFICEQFVNFQTFIVALLDLCVLFVYNNYNALSEEGGNQDQNGRRQYGREL